MGVHLSMVSREIRRNAPARGPGTRNYVAGRAQHKTDNLHAQKTKRILFNEEIKKQRASQLTQQGSSPGFISQVGRRTGSGPVSHESVYNWLCSTVSEKLTFNRENTSFGGRQSNF